MGRLEKLILVGAVLGLGLEGNAWAVVKPNFIVIIADAAQNGLSGQYQSITEGVVLVATILFWNFAIDTLDYRFPHLGINASAPRLVVSNGRMLHKNMQKEELSEEQLMSHLRQQGVEDLKLISKAYVEGDGRVSVIKSRGV